MSMVESDVVSVKLLRGMVVLVQGYSVLFAAQPPRKDIIFDDIVTRSFLWCHARCNKAFSWDRFKGFKGCRKILQALQWKEHEITVPTVPSSLIEPARRHLYGSDQPPLMNSRVQKSNP
ncbi:hypothetical protein Tco_1257171 [Tanacetum coccineum]